VRIIHTDLDDQYQKSISNQLAKKVNIKINLKINIKKVKTQCVKIAKIGIFGARYIIISNLLYKKVYIGRP
jgi:hypothetical protein